ncbi:MAG: hypothetical protein WC121_05755 [Candidatus Kapaibacterium sp.]
MEKKIKLLRKMNIKLLLITIFFLLILTLEAKEKEDNVNVKPMINLIENIIKTPVRMIDIMNDDENINCSKIVSQFTNEEWRLIDFTIVISNIRCKNYNYDSFEIHNMNDTFEKVIYIHYIVHKDEENQAIYSFKFFIKDFKVIFGGVVMPKG